MSIQKKRKEKKKRSYKILLACVIFFGIGYYILNYVSKLEKPPGGMTFNVIVGCILMAISSLIFILTIKKQYFTKKRKRTNHVFLENKREDQNQD